MIQSKSDENRESHYCFVSASSAISAVLTTVRRADPTET